MKCKYVTLFVITFLLNMMFWYYISAFCSVYVKSSLGWVYSGILNIALSYGFIQFLNPITKACCRVLVVRFNNIMYIFIYA
jgi:hypothetical protein